MKRPTWKTGTLLVGGAILAVVVSPFARADYQSTVLSQGPVGYWRMNETAQPPSAILGTNQGSLGSTANGSFLVDPIRGLPGALAGDSDTAVGFSNPGNVVGYCGTKIDVPNNPGLNPNGSFTVEFWAKPSGSTPDVFCAISSMDPGDPATAPWRSGWLFYQTAANKWQFRLGSTNGYSDGGVIIGGTVTPGAWHHLVGVFDATSSNAYLYVNGVLAFGPRTLTSYNPNGGRSFRMGGTPFGGSLGNTAGNRGFSGALDEVAFYNTMLNADTIKAHYDAASTNAHGYASQILASQPVCYWRLDEPGDPPAVNLGTLGSAADGAYIYDAKAGVPGPITPTYPGFAATNKAAAFDAGGGVVRIPPLNVNTNTVTISCWINATNTQAIGAGLVLQGSGADASGLTIDQVNAGLGLGYVWNGQNYGVSFSSDFGLPPLPDSDWAYAALVIQPASATLYICDRGNYTDWASAVNTFNVNHTPQAFASTTLVGAAAGYTTRNFNGAIDEVAIFNRALSPGELYTQYASAVGGVPLRIFTDLSGPSGAVAAGDPIALSVDAGGTPPLVYIWHKDGTPIATTTNNGVFTIASSSLGDSGTYDVVITNASGSIQSQQLPVSVVVPSAPNIVQIQGYVSRTLYPTGTLSIAVTATGGGLKYQWYKNASPIASATGSTFTIPHVTTNDAGSYSFYLTNSVGTVTSGPPAVITIPSVTAGSYEAAIVASAPEAWWRLDEPSGSTNMFDGMGHHDGCYTNASGAGTLPTLGTTGALVNNSNTAATFTSTGQGIGFVPYSPALNPSKYSVEAWVKTTVTDGQAPVSASFNGGGWWMGTASGWWTGSSFQGNWGNGNNTNTAAAITTNRWSYVVINYNAAQTGSDGNVYPWTLYVNGQTDGYIWRTATAATNAPLIIGAHGVSDTALPAAFFDGQVDEVAVYPRVLSGAEIQAHYTARGTVPLPVSFLAPLMSQIVTTGKRVSFSTRTNGTPPISLQWYKDGSPISGATGTNYTINSTSLSDSGTYVLWGTNAVSTNSVSATLMVIEPVGYANVTNGLVLHLKFDGDTTDSSGRGNNATPVNSPTFVTGKIGSQAFHFNTDTTNKVYNYATLGATLPADLKFSSNVNFSVAYWIRLPAGALPGDLPILCDATGSTFSPGITIAPSYKLGGWGWSLNGTGIYGANNSINDGNWHCLVHVFNRTANGLTYLDGVLVDSHAIASVGDLDQSGPMNIGQDPTGAYAESGVIDLDDLGIWSRLLTPLEVAQIESAGRTAGRSFDTVAPPAVTLTITQSGTNVTISWSSGTLLQSDSLGATASWTQVPGATAPSYTLAPGATNKFYRVQVQ